MRQVRYSEEMELIDTSVNIVPPGTPGIETIVDDELYWLHLNQQFRPIPAQMLYPVHNGIDHLLQHTLEMNQRAWDRIIPVNFVLRYRTMDQRCPPQHPVRVRLSTSLRTRRNPDGTLDRAFLYHAVRIESNNESNGLIAVAESWQALVRLFDAPERRRPTELPEIAKEIPESSIGPEAPLLQGGPALEPADLGNEPGSGTYDDIFVFHLDRTDLLQHTNTVAYLHIAEDFLARGFYERGGNPARLRPRELLVRFRKPFLLGQVGHLHCQSRAGDGAFSSTVWFEHEPATDHGERSSVAVRIDGDLDEAG